MTINPHDDKSYQQVAQHLTWISLIKSWATLFLICLSAVTILVVLVAGVRVMVLRLHGDANPLLQSSAKPSPTVRLVVPTPSPVLTDPTAVGLPAPPPDAVDGAILNPTPSVLPQPTPT